MTPATRRLSALLVALVAALAVASGRPESAPAGGDDNVAVAINTRDGSSLFRFAFSIRRVTGDVVDQTNAAVAYASCQDCQTVAVALQVVLVFSDSPDVVTPTNLAIALNADCAACATAALAYQYVIGGGGPVRFTAEGNRRIARIRREFRRLRRSGLPLLEILSRVRELNAELRDVLATELAPAGRDQTGRRDGSGGAQSEPEAPPPEGPDDTPSTLPEPSPDQTTPSQPPPEEQAPSGPGAATTP